MQLNLDNGFQPDPREEKGFSFVLQMGLLLRSMQGIDYMYISIYKKDAFVLRTSFSQLMLKIPQGFNCSFYFFYLTSVDNVLAMFLCSFISGMIYKYLVIYNVLWYRTLHQLVDFVCYIYCLFYQ